MTPLHPLPFALLAVVVLTAGVIDIRSRRIPNWLVLFGLAAGFGANLYLSGWAGLWFALKGMGLALLVYMPLYLLRGMGAGDVKLMAAVGSLAGAWNWFGIFIATGLLGGVCAVVLVLLKGQALKTILNLGFIIKELLAFRAPYLKREELDVRNPEAIRLPHGAVIALGVIAFFSALRLLAPR